MFVTMNAHMKIQDLALEGIKLITSDAFTDERGSFEMFYHKEKFHELGIDTPFAQDNFTYSRKGVLRGLHFQWDKPLRKLMRVVSGRLLAVAVDIRIDSPTLGQHVAVELSEEKNELLFVPFGFATGISALTDDLRFVYKYSTIYNAKGESGIAWNDPALQIDWRVADPIVSARDKVAQTLEAWLSNPESKRFTMESSRRFGANNAE
jgi:dTDP-4-dehydrorhamnose 3,5-epimerase